MIGASSLLFVLTAFLGTTTVHSVTTKKFMKTEPSFDSTISEKSVGAVTFDAKVNYRVACPQRCSRERCCCLACVKNTVCHMFNTLIPDNYAGVTGSTAISFDSCYRNLDAGAPYSRNCLDVKQNGNTANGMYTIYLDDCCTGPRNVSARQVFCNMALDGGGWTVIQRRRNILPRVDFQRTWEEYAAGFGDQANGEFWLGNDLLHALTAQKNYELRIDLTNFQGATRIAKYSHFYVYPREDYFLLDVSGYSGTAGDAMGYHNGYQFTTKDLDLDADNSANCAIIYTGGFWYNWCFSTNINGINYQSQVDDRRSINWMPWQNYISLKGASMMIRPTV